MARRSILDLPEPKRLLILETAAFEFAAHGFEGASLNRIIERCVMSKSSFYYYFDDKAQLFAVLIDQATARLAADVGFPSPETLSGADFWAQIEALFDRMGAQWATCRWCNAPGSRHPSRPRTSWPAAMATWWAGAAR